MKELLTPFGFGAVYLAFPALLLVFLALEGFSALRARRRYRRERSLPVEARTARVLRRWMTPGCRHHFADGQPYRVSLARYHARLALENEGEATFLLSRAQYDALREGMAGVLTRRGKSFLSFEQK